MIGANGDLVATVSVSAPSARVKVTDRRKHILPVLLNCAEQISDTLKKMG